MTSKDEFKAQAKRLVREMNALNRPLKYQDALQVLAQVTENLDWKTLSAKLDDIPAEQSKVPGAGYLYRVPVTVDMTMTAYIYARGEDREAAIDNARQFASEGNARFEIDDGNYRGLCDHYCPDKTEVVPLPEIPGLPASVFNGGVQDGAFDVQLSQLGDDDDTYWADMRIFDPDQPEPEIVSCLTSFPISATYEESEAVCHRIAKLFSANTVELSKLELRTAEHVFYAACQGETTVKAYDKLAKLLRESTRAA